jgi:hypothetical protein
MKPGACLSGKKNRQNEIAKAGFVILLTIWQMLAFSQIQQSKGDILLVTGETKHGTISSYSDQPEPNIFLFDSLGVKSYYFMTAVKEINLLSGEKYAAKWLQTEKDSTELLFKVLIESPKLCMYVRAEDGSSYYYVSKDDLIYRLENNEMVETTNATKKIRQDYKYIRILGSLMADRMDLVSKLNEVKLDEDDIRTVISEYNKGIATYYWTKKLNQKKDPNWMVFTQYSHFGSYLGEQTKDKSFGLSAGIQYYFSKKSRNSFKFSVDYANYHFDDFEDGTVISLGTRWQYDFVRTEFYNFYFQIHILDISSIYTKTTDKDLVTTKHYSFPILRFSPAFGMEIKPVNRMILILEVNNLFQINIIGRSYSLGVKYDIGEKYW